MSFIQKNSLSLWVILSSLLVILFIFDPRLVDPTQPIKLVLLSTSCLIGNVFLLFQKRREGIEIPIVFLVFSIFLFFELLSMRIEPENGIYSGLVTFLLLNFLWLGHSFLKHNKSNPTVYLPLFFSVFQFIAVFSTLGFSLFSNSAAEYSINSTGGGLFVNPNLCAQLLFLSLPFTLYGCYASTSSKTRGLFMISSTLSIVLIFVLGSKAVILALGALLLTCVLFSSRVMSQLNRPRRKLLFLTMFVVFVGIASWATFSFDLFSKFDSLQVRKELWKKSISLIKEQPIAGHGLGNWKTLQAKSTPDNESIANKALSSTIYSTAGNDIYLRPHHDFLWVWSESGLGAFLSYLVFFVLLLYSALQKAVTAVTKQEKSLHILLLGTLLGYCIIASLSYPKERIEHSMVLGIIVLLVTRSTRLKFDTPSYSIASNIIAFSLLLVSGFSVFAGVQRLNAEKQFTGTLKAKQNGDWNLLLEKSSETKNKFYSLGSNGIPIEWYQGMAKMNLGQISEANIHFKEAYTKSPYHVHVINNLATTTLLLGQINEAEKLYQEALRINPNFEDSRINLSGLYFNQQEIDLAWKQIQKVEYRSNHPQYRTFLTAIGEKQYANTFQGLTAQMGFPHLLTEFYEYEEDVFFHIYSKSVRHSTSMNELFLQHFKSFLRRKDFDQESEQTQVPTNK